MPTKEEVAAEAVTESTEEGEDNELVEVELDSDSKALAASDGDSRLMMEWTFNRFWLNCLRCSSPTPPPG